MIAFERIGELHDHPIFRRDPFLDRVRQDPEFVRFLAESRARWEEYQRRLK